MSLLNRMRKQTAVYWELDEPDSVTGGGLPRWKTPVELRVRWVDKVEAMTTPDGETIKTDHVVYVDGTLTIPLFSVLLLADLVSAMDDGPEAYDGAAEVRAVERTPNLRATKFKYVLKLAKR